MKNKRLNQTDREFIERARKKGCSVKEIADFLGYSRQAIYYELKKGTVQQRDSMTWELKAVYLSDAAQRVTMINKKNCGSKPKLESSDAVLHQIAELIINKKYSPEAALLTIESKKVSVKTIYNYIHKGYFKELTIEQLPYCRKKKKKKKHVVKRIQKPKEKMIDSRSAEIETRETYGHWEMDTVYSSKDDKTALLVLSERMTRAEIIIQTADRTLSSIVKGLDWLERKLGSKLFRETFKTITCDNGVEFSDWDRLEKSKINKNLKRTTIYYCHSYSSFERGTNENINRMIRRWIPKGDDIGLYSKKEIKKIQDWINNYPRTILNDQSSIAYMESLGIKNIMQML
jgi:IS30 family transposase